MGAPDEQDVDDHDVEQAGAAVLAMLLRLLGELRAAHVDVAMVEVLDAAEALRHLDLTDRSVLRRALQATLVKHLEDEALFDVLFDRCFPLTRPGAGTIDAATPRRTAAMIRPRLGPRRARRHPPPARRRQTARTPTPRTSTAVPTSSRRSSRPFAAATSPPWSRSPPRPWAPTAASGRRRARSATSCTACCGRSTSPRSLSRAMRAERESAPDGPGQELALRLRRDELARRIDDFRRMLAQELRHQQLQLHDPVPAPPRRLDELDLLDASTLDQRAMRQAVRPLARKLAARVAQRRRLHRGGRLDVRRTIRRSLSAGGTPIDPAFRRRKTSKPDVVVLCDLSGSVAEFAGFTLTLVHALHAELARLRSFVFVDGIAEVTALTRRHRRRGGRVEPPPPARRGGR